MKRSSLLLVLVLAVAACGGGTTTTPAVGNGGGPAVADTFGAALAHDVGAGAPVAIIPDAEGLLAISADGERSRRVVSNARTLWVLVDDRAGVVWFGGDDGAIQILDLGAPGAEPTVETVVRGLPQETDVGMPLVSVRYPDGELLTAGAVSQPHVVVDLSGEPRLGVDGGILELWEQTGGLEAALATATVATERLAALAARGAGRSTRLAAPAVAAARVTTIDPAGCPDDPEICGTAEPIGGTGLWRVAVEYGCGDFCYVTWQAYDPASGQLRAEPWLIGLDDLWVAPDGSAFVRGGQVIRFDTGPIAGAGEGTAVGGGWIGGGYYHGI